MCYTVIHNVYTAGKVVLYSNESAHCTLKVRMCCVVMTKVHAAEVKTFCLVVMKESVHWG